MKTRITFLLLFLSAFTFQCGAQKYLNVYQDNIVIKRIPTTEIDSISVTQSTPRTVNMWYNGYIFLSYAAEEIDSVVVSNVEEPISYIGIVGFNDELYKKDIGVLSSSTVGQYKSFINGLPQKDGTLLYYAVDNALDMLESANLKTRVRDVSFITFTDGLDMGSTMMNDRYWTARDYLNAMSSRIKNTRIQGLSLNAFTVGLRGNDVTDVALFKNNIISLASSPDNAFEVSNISEFRARLQDIANKIISVSNRQTVSVKVPGIDNGSRMRFTFDGQQSTNSQMYIEGTFNMQDRSLHNVTYHGMRSRSGSVVQGTQTGIFLTFTFTGLQRLDGLGLIPMNNIKHYYQTPSLSTWQINSEFQPGNNTQRTTNYTGTAIFLVLDCSSSLGGDISKMKNYANDFISLVAGNALPVDVQTPKNLKAEIIESGGKQAVQLTWNWARFAETYDIYRSSSSSGNFTCIAKDVTETAYIDEEPLNGSNYYRIVGNGYGMSGTASATANVSVILKSPQNVIVALDDTRFVINVSWEPVKYAEYYRVYRNGTLVADNITSTSWTDAAPNSGNNYYNVTALGYGLVSAQSSNSTTVNYALQTPANVKAAMDDTDFVINVSWDAVKYAKSYTIFRNGTQIAEGITTNHWTDQSPRAGSNYYSVKALCDGHVSSLSANSESVNYALDTPQDVNAAIADDKFVINVTWTPVKYAEFYRVYRSSRNSSSYFSIVADSVYSTAWQDASPLSGDNYYRIYAVSHGVTSSASNVSGVVKYELDTPQNVTAAMDDNEFIIHVNWDAVKYAESYTIYRNGTQVAEGITTTSWNDASPRSGNNYYSVKAVGHGITSSSSSNSPTINCSLSAPTNVTAALDDNDFIIHVNWDAVKYAESYIIYRNGTQVAEGITSTSWNDESPRSGNNYYSVKAVGHGMTSSSSTNSPTINCSLSAPTNVTASLNADGKTIRVAWDAIKYAESYDIYRNGSLLKENVLATFFTDESPLRYNVYYVIAKGHGLNSGQSQQTEQIRVFNTPTNGITITVNGIKFNMIKIEGGTFQMGREGVASATPVHQVTLTNDYYIGETEVTQELWTAVMGSNPSEFKSSDQLPVEMVSWNDCQTFITKLNELTGRTFRLPTEAEWEFAARGGNASEGHAYSGSNTVRDVAWYISNSSSKTHEVATKAPNELGIYDMSGNVYEWCQDWQGSYSSSAQTNPTGPASGSNRVGRGGSWCSDDYYCRVAIRFRYAPTCTYEYLGLRLAL